MLKRNWTRLRQSFRASRSPRESSITKLPVELLRLILELLCTPDEDRKSLLALALTCRTLWVLAREYIPRDVNVNAHSTSTTFTLFERSVTGDSSYARNVQTLIFKTGGKKCDIPKARVRQLFICLSALRVLKLDGLPRSYVVPTLFSGQLELKKTVKRLKIPGGMTIAMVAELTSFPAIRKWRFWSLDDLECYAEFPEVEKIYLGKLVFQRSQVGLPLFENIVSRSQNLKTLETNLPFLPPVVKTDISHEIIIENTFSALRLQTILLHAADTLTSLNLHSQGQLWRQHDGTRLDLSNFTTLKSITLSAMCMCAPLSRDISRDGLFKLLPRSVEKFTVRLVCSILRRASDIS